MGYETKLIIGIAVDIFHDLKEGFYFDKYAEIDLCKMGYDSNIANIPNIFNQGTIPYYYADDGNTQISEDYYGGKLKPIDINIVIKALRKDVKKDDYRRFKWALDLLTSMQKNAENEEITVMFYGH